MDSDDNCLVIDETDGSIETDKREENNASINGSVKETPTKNASNLPTNGTSDAMNSPKSVSANETPSKSKERHDEKSKSKSDKNKQKKPANDKRTSPSPCRPQWIRLTREAFKTRLLNINAQKHQLYNMVFSTRDGFLVGEMPQVYPAPPTFPDLSLTQLMNWPGIRIEINLEHISFVHEVNENCDRDIVFGDDDLIGIDTTPNPLETRYLQKVPSSKTYPIISKELIETYVTSLMEAAPLYEVGPSKLPEIEQSFRKLLEDIDTLKFPTIQTRIIHSYFVNSQKYFRIIDNDYGANNNNNLKVRLREVLNPEVNYHFRATSLALDQFEVWHSAIETYFTQIFVDRSAKVKEALRDRYKKCLTLKCETCHESFEGALWAVKLKDHIKQRHFIDKPWTCVGCLRSFEQSKLLTEGWKHDCVQ